jgi:hypothetical protein
LHGINGSGKTSVLRAIASLLTPDPLWLSNSSFEKISVELEHDGRLYLISATSEPSSAITLQISGGIELIDTFAADELALLLKAPPDEEYYRASLAAQEDLNSRTRRLIEAYKTFSFIGSLPTPIFLGLDRTTLSPVSQRIVQRGARARTVNPYFRTSLDDALYEAERLLLCDVRVVLDRHCAGQPLTQPGVMSGIGAHSEEMQCASLSWFRR